MVVRYTLVDDDPTSSSSLMHQENPVGIVGGSQSRLLVRELPQSVKPRTGGTMQDRRGILENEKAWAIGYTLGLLVLVQSGDGSDGASV